MEQDTVLGEKMDGFELKDSVAVQKTLTEKEALQEVKRGNKSAFQLIVSRHMKSAYYIALGFVHNQQDALDLSQDAFVKAFRKMKGFDLKRPFFPWFYKIMKNLCLDYLKKNRLNEVPLSDVHVAQKNKNDQELVEIVWKGIGQLSFEQKEVIILRYFRQYSYKEIAEITRRPIGTVMSSLYYAKNKLKEIMEKFLETKGKD